MTDVIMASFTTLVPNQALNLASIAILITTLKAMIRVVILDGLRVEHGGLHSGGLCRWLLNNRKSVSLLMENFSHAETCTTVWLVRYLTILGVIR